MLKFKSVDTTLGKSETTYVFKHARRINLQFLQTIERNY